MVTSSLVARLFKRLGIQAVNYIPHRMDEGMAKQSSGRIAKSQKIHLLVTVDCGINAFDAVACGQCGGMM